MGAPLQREVEIARFHRQMAEHEIALDDEALLVLLVAVGIVTGAGLHPDQGAQAAGQGQS